MLLIIVLMIATEWASYNSYIHNELYSQSLLQALLRQELLEVELPSSFMENDYATRMECELFLEIPCQNRILWKAIIDMLLKFAESDIELWKDVIRKKSIRNNLYALHSQFQTLPLACTPYNGSFRFALARGPANCASKNLAILTSLSTRTARSSCPIPSTSRINAIRVP